MDSLESVNVGHSRIYMKDRFTCDIRMFWLYCDEATRISINSRQKCYQTIRIVIVKNDISIVKRCYDITLAARKWVLPVIDRPSVCFDCFMSIDSGTLFFA